MQRCGDDGESLEPHPDVHKNADDEHERYVSTVLTEPVDLRRNHVTENHGPVCPRIVSHHTIDEDPQFPVTARIPGNKELHTVGISYHHTRRQQNLIHVVEVL